MFLGSAVGPHPYPTIVHEFQKAIEEFAGRFGQGRLLADYVIACVGGDSAIGASSVCGGHGWC